MGVFDFGMYFLVFWAGSIDLRRRDLSARRLYWDISHIFTVRLRTYFSSEVHEILTVEYLVK